MSISSAWIAYGVGFFSFMLVHELTIEAVFNIPELPHSMSIWISLAQFGGCVVVPAVISAIPGAVEKVAPSEKLLPSVNSLREPKTTAVLWIQYVGLAGLVFCATAIANHAVNFVQYPVKVVFKSSKLVPTMIVGTVMGNTKRYSSQEYVAALMICAGDPLLMSQSQS